MSKLLYGSSVLSGDNTVPGAVLPPKLKKAIPTIFQAVREYGCDFYPTVVQMLDDDEMSEIAAYGGFPVRYNHWRFGMEYEGLQRGYEVGLHRIYELVINTKPCYIYCMTSNTLVDNILVVAHALGHNDFFKNNINFAHTDTNMLNKMANNGERIRRYMNRWGKERVTDFIDHVLRLDNLIDPSKAWKPKKRKKVIYKDKRNYHFPRYFRVDEDREYMERWINTEEWLEKEYERIRQREAAEALELFNGQEKDILGFLRDHAPLKPWQADIIAMLHEEAMYFSPQARTKVLNEGWASKIDFEMMSIKGLASFGGKSGSGIVEYAKHKAGVLGGKYSTNPYKLGFDLLTEIEDRWNKGKFGKEWENCEDMRARENWDTKAGLGKEKIFEVRKLYNDFTFIAEFFDEDFCEKYEYFEWAKFPNGEYKIISRDFKGIKNKLLKMYLNGGNPDVRLTDCNHKNRGWLLLEHQWDGRPLYEPWATSVLTSICALWNKAVVLSTRSDDETEIVYVCDNPSDENKVVKLPREEYENR